MKRKLSLFLALVMILTSVFVTGASATGEEQDFVDEEYSEEEYVDEDSEEESEDEYAEEESEDEYAEEESEDEYTEEESEEETDSDDAESEDADSEQEEDAEVESAPVEPEEGTYESYKADKEDFPNAESEIVIDATTYVSAEGAVVENLDTFKAEDGEERETVVKWTNEDGSLTYNISVPADGLYTFKFLYYALPGRKNPISLGLKVDGEYFFENMKEFELPRIFKDDAMTELDETGKAKLDANGNVVYKAALDEKGNPKVDDFGNPVYQTIRVDGIGNEFAAEQAEHFAFQEGTFIDPTGLETMPYALAFTAGSHTITVESVAEPVALDAIVLCPIETYESYADVSADYDTSKKVKGETIKIEGEDADYKSSYSLVAQYDQSDPSVSSEKGSNPYLTRINYIGNVNWASPGQRITWEVNVPEEGYYKLAFRYRQAHVLNGSSYRKLLVNGEVPFEEAANLCFNYDLNWNHCEFANEEGDPYLIYFKKGYNTISMEVSLGELTSTVRELKEVTYKVGNIYREMIKVTGESPDNSRDYNLFEQIPNFNENLAYCSEELYRIAAKTEELAGQTGGTNATTIRGLCEVLDNMVKHKFEAHQYKSLFYNNYTSVSALVYTMMEMGLDIDYLELGAPDAKFVNPESTWWSKTSYSVQRFFSSFSADYNNISGDLETKESITIWANWGRDQIRVLNNLIQSSFTPQTGIGVNLKMSNASYTQAILSGKGPDCSLHMARSEPVNLALRDSMVDLTQFSDYDEVMKRFMTADAALPFTFDRDSTDDKPAGVYALPDTLNFYMLFYRTDIFEEYKLTPPTTWDEYLHIASILYRNNLQASLPYTQITSASMVNAGVGSLSILPTFIMQMGGEIYNANGSATLLSDATSIKAFEFWTDFFGEYKFPVSADFFNRFRIGTMPMGIQNYTTYIQFTMAAPEITGKWKMSPIPGFKNEDGTINNCQAGSGTGCGILRVSKNPEGGWEFLKWWTSAETQLSYSNNCESILGVSGRVATANPEALKQMGWDKESLEALISQWSRMKEVPEIPGSYYTARSIDQAYWNVVNNSKNAKDMMIKWAEISDAEIERKREQYNVK